VDLGYVLQPGWRALDPPDILTFNRRAINLLPPPFTTLWTEDHFQKGTAPALEAWTTLAFIAGEFPRFRLGNLVLGQSYRNPALLAKMAATLQYLCGGRLILGLGAGWQEDEYRAYSYDYPPVGIRIAQLAEAIELIRAMWTASPATYQGRYYRVEQAICEPRPAPPPPIVVGANGDRILRVVARLADGWNTPSPLPLFERRYALLRHYCAELGRDPSSLAVSVLAHAAFTEDAVEFAQKEEALRTAEIALLGPTARDALAQLGQYAAAGVSHVAIKPHDLATLETICAEVAPALVGADGG